MFKRLIDRIFASCTNEKEKRILLITIALIYFLCLGLIVSLTVTSFYIAKQSVFKSLRERLVNLTAIAPIIVDPDLVEKYRKRLDATIDVPTAKNIEQEADYRKLFSQINSIWKTDPETITCVYVLTATEVREKAKFLVDCNIYEHREKESRGQKVPTTAQI
jgi:hypothetical protein